MANPIYTTVDGNPLKLAATIKQAVLAQSDWAHLQLTTGTQATTLSSGASAGATSISTAATIPSGSYVVIGNGAANPEVRLTTGVSGSGPYTVTFADALVGTYSSGAAVGVGSYIKATTTRGAQMVIDLADAAPGQTNLQLGIYRTHDGTTGVDKLVRYIKYRNTTGATTDNIHVEVACSKEMIYIGVEGPRGGETNPDNSTSGSLKQSLALADIVPYFAGDTTPAVCCIGCYNLTVAPSDLICHVSRNAGNNSSWVQAHLGTVQFPTNGGQVPQLQLNATADGNFYVFPYIVFEGQNGIRGTLNQLYFAGLPFYSNGISGESPSNIGETVSYSGRTYKIIYANKGLVSNWQTCNGFGLYDNSVSAAAQYAPLIAVPMG